MELVRDGYTLHSRIEGAGDPLLLVHGFPLSGRLWDGVVERLQDDLRLIVPDLRGHGASGASEEATMKDYATDLNDLLHALDEKRPVVLVGLSMGGYIAFEFYRRFPERVRALVLSNTRAQADTEEAAKARHELAERALREGSGVVAQDMVGKLFAPHASEELRTHWRQIMAATPPIGVAAALRAMAQRRDSFETLRTARIPIHIIGGEEDRITGVEDARRMHEAAPNSRLDIVPGAGHMTPVEQPDRFVAALRGFLQDLDPL